MPRKIIFSIALLGGAAFYWLVPFDHLFAAFQPITVVLSIVVAALLVRLNRGMPSLDWKSAERNSRVQLTSAIVELTREYVGIIFINALLLLILITLIIISLTAIQDTWDENFLPFLSAVIGAILTLSSLRMGYVIWRDYDIVKLQKQLIDKSPDANPPEAEISAANKKIADIRAASLRK